MLTEANYSFLRSCNYWGCASALCGEAQRCNT